MRYFLGKRRSLGDHRPIELLRVRKVAEVIAHAKGRAHPEENTW